MSYAFYSLLMIAAAGGSAASPTPAELAKAVEAFTGRPVAATDVRHVACAAIEEEPTEAVCKWEQKIGKRWQRYSTTVAVDGKGWLLIDGPELIR
jgi:hypothetical protein